MDITSLKTDNNLEEDGVKLPFGDASITLRSRNSEAYRKVMESILKPHESSIALGVFPEDKAKAAMIEGAAKGLIVTWDGFTESGEPVPFSVEKAQQYLNDVTVFRNFVDTNADKIDNFRKAKEDAEAKN